MTKKIIISLLIILLVSNGLFIKAKKVQSYERPMVVINELMWMGSSISSYDEWLELKNLSDSRVDLSNWYLSKKSSGEEKLMLEIPEGEVLDNFYIISNYSSESEKSALNVESNLVDTSVSLSNSQLEIKLYDDKGNLIDTADDGSGQPLSGEYSSGEVWQSMERNTKIEEGSLESSWHIASQKTGFKTDQEFGTPGQENSNQPPVIEAGEDREVLVGEKVYFDASDSFDPEEDELSFSWDFGDGQQGEGITPHHVFQTVGDYGVTLTISDGYNKVTASLSVVVKEKEEEEEEFVFDEVNEEEDNQEEENENLDLEDENTEDKAKNIEYDFSDKILINEVFPNPEGSDLENEFIELINKDNQPVNLRGWQIYNGKKYFTFEKDTLIETESFLVLGYQQTKIYLKNSGMTLQLLDPKQKVVNGVEYPEAIKGSSFARKAGTNSWAWTSLVSPGSENEILGDVKKKRETEDLEEVENSEKVLGIKDEAEVKELEVSEAAKISEVSINRAKELEKGQEVIVKGFVAVEPAVFGVQYFYLFDGQNGIKIYSYKKDFPDLKIGDYVKITGKISESSGEKKINIGSEEDVKILSDQDIFPEAIRLSLGEIDETYFGSLVIVNGSVLENSKTKMLLSEETEEIEIYYKRGTNINGHDYKEGSQVEVLGILISYDNDLGFRLLPRVNSDIRVLDEARVLGEEKISEAAEDEEGEVLGATSEKEIMIEGEDNKSNIYKYLWVCLAGVIITGGTLLIKWFKARKLDS
ncbi:MAG: lamin tail domain-containing protein [Patescibacteria group bacterium]|nr:lamin tail domain-containing protein [Patescibacteria group bacterium]